jgi:hypothetical protein
MLIVKVWCSSNISQSILDRLRDDLIQAVKRDVPSQCVLDHRDMVVLFPSGVQDTQIIVAEITGARFDHAHDPLSACIGKELKQQFPGVRVVSGSYPGAAHEWDSKFSRAVS